MNRTELREAVFRVIDHLQEEGVELPQMLKRRDKREPERREKELLEDRIFVKVRRHFKKQAAEIERRLEMYYPMRKSTPFGSATNATPLPTSPLPSEGERGEMKEIQLPLDDIFGDDEELTADLIRLITAGGTAGVRQFAESVGVQLDYTLTNQAAAEWAKKYVGTLVKDIDATTLDVLQNAIASFVEIPGFTIRDIMDLLPYDDERAMMIAVTETTRAYSQGQQLGAEQLAKEFPGVAVVQQWFTNQDDKVCELCGPLTKNEVSYGETFYDPDEKGDGFPPRHVNCRCWMDYRTDISA